MRLISVLCALVIALASPVFGQTIGSSGTNINSIPVALTDGATITVPCPGNTAPTTYYLTLTGNNHQILFPSCTAASNGQSVKFRINAGTTPFTGLTFATGYNWAGHSPYAICTAAATPNAACPAAEVASQIDWFGCDVVGTSSASTEWDCWVPQYNIGPPFTLVAQTSCTGTSGAGCTTGAINTTGANLFVITDNGDSASGIADSSSNTYTQAVTANSSGAVCTIDYVISPTTNAAQTFTMTNHDATLGVFAFNIPSPATDGTNSTGGSFATSIQPGSITPTSTDVVVATGVIAGANGLTINSSFVAGNQNYVGSPGNYLGALNAYLYPSTTAINPTLTTTSGSNSLAACMAAFK